MRITITGAAGMLGRDLAAVFSSSPRQHELHLIDKRECEITDRGQVRACLGSARPRLVIHAAAYTDVDGAEADAETAVLVNAEGTRNVATVAAEIDARLIYISTDYVFDGCQQRPYVEKDVPNPLSVYGRSKWMGECAVREHPDSLIVRTAWLYGRHGRHFPGAIVAQARKGAPLQVVDDQTGCPTWTRDLAQAMTGLVDCGQGILHLAGSGSCTWYEFASAIIDEARKHESLPAVTLGRTSTAELGRPAPRPGYSVLESTRIQELGIAALPHWRDALARFFSRDEF